ncbi:MAG: cell division protein FtsQ/DivIB [Nitrospinota bacterium]
MAVLTRSSRIQTRVARPVRYAFIPVKKETAAVSIRPVIMFLALATIMAGLLKISSSIYREAVTHPYFQVKAVDITGLKNVSREELLSVIRPLLEGSIFTSDIGGIANFLKANPWIGDVSIRRRYPDTLWIGVTERVPAAIVQIDPGIRYLIDREGHLLGKSEGNNGHVLITGIAAPVSGTRLEDDRLNDAFRLTEMFKRDVLFHDYAAAVDVSDLDKITVRTENSGTIITFGPAKSRWNDNFLEYLVVRRILEETGESFSGMDLSFKDQVIVSHGRGSLPEKQKILIKG